MNTKSKAIRNKTHIPCPSCTSSDAYVEYDDGHGYCFSCNKVHRINQFFYDTSSSASCAYKGDDKVTQQYVPHRGITVDTLRFYDVKTNVNELNVPVSTEFKYGDDFTITREWDRKAFKSSGISEQVKLFGQDKFNSGSAKAITIFEGAHDALAGYQMLGSKYPAVAVRSASTALNDLKANRAYVNSFDQIYFCFDNDAAGEKALGHCASLFDVNKVYHVKLDKYKDANDYLEKNASKEFTSAWFNAPQYMRKGIVSSYKAIEELLSTDAKATDATYPFSTLNDLTFGIRFGEVNLFTAQEKTGKTEVMRAIEYHLLKTTDHNIGIIHLEEQEKRSIQGLVSYELNTPCHLPTSSASKEDQIKAYKQLTKRDGRLSFYTHFGSDDPDTILDVIRYLATVCHCKFIFLDHITMLVTGFEEDDERKKLDYISTRLAMLTRELNFTLFLVSHVNDNGQTRGSRNISKIADLIVHLDRDIESINPDERNRTNLLIKGNRFGGTTGPSGVLNFNSDSYTIKELDDTELEKQRTAAGVAPF